MERKPCRRCLLQDIDESQLMEAIQQRIAALPASQRASAEDYAARLSECRMCDFSGQRYLPEMRLLCRTPGGEEKRILSA